MLALSMHIGLENDYNQIHPHARCEMSNDILYGAYYNSEERVSLYFGKTLDNVERGWDMEYGPYPNLSLHCQVFYQKIKIIGVGACNMHQRDWVL